MKKLFVLFLCVFAMSQAWAQSPDLINYQSVVRDASGGVIPNQAVSFRISILEGGPTGPAVYAEEHNVTTNNFGLANLQIGAGSVVSGSMATVNWGGNSHYVQIELDAAGGASYTLMGTQQLISVPYALHARTVEMDNVDDADADPNNELNSTVTLNGNSLEVTDAGGTLSADLSSLIDDADADSTNELNTTVVLNGNTLEVTDAGGTLTADLSSLIDDADADSTNELNTTVVLNGTTLEVTDAGGTLTADLSSLIDDADADSTNELNTTVVLNGNTLEVTDAGGTLTADLSSLIDDADADPTNELQDLSLSNDSILISNGTGVDISGYLDSKWTQSGGATYLTSTGQDVSIGGTSSVHKLEITDTGNAYATNSVDVSELQLTVRNTGTANGQGAGIGLGNTGSNNNITGAIVTEQEGSQGRGSMHFATKDNTFSNLDIPIRMTLDASGNLGVGTQSPNARLEVNGGNLLIRNSSANGYLRLSPSGAGYATDPELVIQSLETGVGADSPFMIARNVTYTTSDDNYHPIDITDQASMMEFRNNGEIRFAQQLTMTDPVVWQDALVIAPNGNVGVGSSFPNDKFQVGEIGDGTVARANSWALFSDERWKRDKEVIPGALDKVSRIHGYYYYWIDRPDQSRQAGVMAQEIEAVLPEVVNTDSEGYKSVDYGKLSALLIEAVKEQQEIIDAQQQYIGEQGSDIEEMKAQLREIRAAIGLPEAEEGKMSHEDHDSGE